MDKFILKLNKLNESERLEISTLLIKAGYTVRLRKEKTTGKTYNHYVEYFEEGSNES
ncbi:MAG: hypothetical protein K0R54_2250 [Clostridiaceae bacterium]|jgi:hypothetical protein|nr:hypothetical protein [Clostridiaceae bacterium]